MSKFSSTSLFSESVFSSFDVKRSFFVFVTFSRLVANSSGESFK